MGRTIYTLLITVMFYNSNSINILEQLLLENIEKLKSSITPGTPDFYTNEKQIVTTSILFKPNNTDSVENNLPESIAFLKHLTDGTVTNNISAQDKYYLDTMAIYRPSETIKILKNISDLIENNEELKQVLATFVNRVNRIDNRHINQYSVLDLFKEMQGNKTNIDQIIDIIYVSKYTPVEESTTVQNEIGSIIDSFYDTNKKDFILERIQYKPITSPDNSSWYSAQAQALPLDTETNNSNNTNNSNDDDHQTSNDSKNAANVDNKTQTNNYRADTETTNDNTHQESSETKSSSQNNNNLPQLNTALSSANQTQSNSSNLNRNFAFSLNGTVNAKPGIIEGFNILINAQTEMSVRFFFTAITFYQGLTPDLLLETIGHLKIILSKDEIILRAKINRLPEPLLHIFSKAFFKMKNINMGVFKPVSNEIFEYQGQKDDISKGLKLLLTNTNPIHPLHDRFRRTNAMLLDRITPAYLIKGISYPDKILENEK